MKKIGINQPYFFPYIGYFQLIDSVDLFILYDIVSFSKKSWVHKNRILVNGRPFSFSLPIKKKSQNSSIENLEIDFHSYERWSSKFLKTLEHSYKNSSNFKEGIEITESVLRKEHKYVTEICESSILTFSEYLGIDTKIKKASILGVEKKESENKADKLIRISRSLGYGRYVNAENGKDLYCKEYFREREVELSFLKSSISEYSQQGSRSFAEKMSIIDVVMNNTREDCYNILSGYSVY